MTDVRTITVAKTETLANLSKIVTQTEDLGPLVGIGNDGTQTVLKVDLDGGEPPKKAFVALATDPPPATADKVVDGQAFVSGAVTAVVVYRPK